LVKPTVLELVLVGAAGEAVEAMVEGEAVEVD